VSSFGSLLPRLGNSGYHPVMANVRPAASLLRELRMQSGTSLRGVASDIGVAPSHLSRLERGEKTGSVEMVTRLATYYGVEVEQLQAAPLPTDVLRILAEHPELIDELRRRYE